MFYLLRFKNGQIYTGFTNDLKRRLGEHKRGKVSSTKERRPLQPIHFEGYLYESDARRREKFLKTSEGKNLLGKQIKDCLSERWPSG